MLSKATLAAGPFARCAPLFRRLHGIDQVACGYTGGVTQSPSASDVATGRTGHIEAVEILFAEPDMDYTALLETFWALHDPTAMNFTGVEDGAQYRSAIFYHDATQGKAARASMAAAQRRFTRPIVTLIEPARPFWPAKDVHVAVPPTSAEFGKHQPQNSR